MRLCKCVIIWYFFFLSLFFFFNTKTQALILCKVRNFLQMFPLSVVHHYILMEFRKHISLIWINKTDSKINISNIWKYLWWILWPESICECVDVFVFLCTVQSTLLRQCIQFFCTEYFTIYVCVCYMCKTVKCWRQTSIHSSFENIF